MKPNGIDLGHRAHTADGRSHESTVALLRHVPRSNSIVIRRQCATRDDLVLQTNMRVVDTIVNKRNDNISRFVSLPLVHKLLPHMRDLGSKLVRRVQPSMRWPHAELSVMRAVVDLSARRLSNLRVRHFDSALWLAFLRIGHQEASLLGGSSSITQVSVAANASVDRKRALPWSSLFVPRLHTKLECVDVALRALLGLQTLF